MKVVAFLEMQRGVREGETEIFGMYDNQNRQIDEIFHMSGSLDSVSVKIFACFYENICIFQVAEVSGGWCCDLDIYSVCCSASHLPLLTRPTTILFVPEHRYEMIFCFLSVVTRLHFISWMIIISYTLTHIYCYLSGRSSFDLFIDRL